MGKIKLNEKQKDIVIRLNDELYTVDYLEEWLNRNDNVYINAPAALSAMGASGFYRAIVAMEQAEIMQAQAADPGKPPAESQEPVASGEPSQESEEPSKPVKPTKTRNNKKSEGKQNENDGI